MQQKNKEACKDNSIAGRHYLETEIAARNIWKFVKQKVIDTYTRTKPRKEYFFLF